MTTKHMKVSQVAARNLQDRVSVKRSGPEALLRRVQACWPTKEKFVFIYVYLKIKTTFNTRTWKSILSCNVFFWMCGSYSVTQRLFIHEWADSQIQQGGHLYTFYINSRVTSVLVHHSYKNGAWLCLVGIMTQWSALLLRSLSLACSSCVCTASLRVLRLLQKYKAK